MLNDFEMFMIMVGLGIGIVLFRGFIQVRLVLKKEGSIFGEVFLYFGCCCLDYDDFYREELD